MRMKYEAHKKKVLINTTIFRGGTKNMNDFKEQLKKLLLQTLENHKLSLYLDVMLFSNTDPDLVQRSREWFEANVVFSERLLGIDGELIDITPKGRISFITMKEDYYDNDASDKEWEHKMKRRSIIMDLFKDSLD